MTSESESLHGRLTKAAKAQGSFIGFAIGDALGWPNESRSRSILHVGKAFTAGSLSVTFRDWRKRAGARFDAYEEPIQSGEYSDDTQLMLCTARSVLKNSWWVHFTKRELPSWTLYERGAGKATRAATKIWAKGRRPWEILRQKDSTAAYFQAGGNGAAMRILPHALCRATAKSFRDLSEEITANSICTHGHPRALLGALLYGYAAWLVFRKYDTLRYGELIENLLDSVETWSRMPALNQYASDWTRAVELTFGPRYNETWTNTVGELTDLLRICDTAMKRGALSVDRSILDSIGAFDRKTNGAGTVSAAAAVFLASRYAVNPQQGVIEAAFSKGADTDTLAAMTGGLLGALSGVDVFRDLADKVQDAPYLRQSALALVNGHTETQQLTMEDEASSRQISVEEFLSRLERLNTNQPLLLPDGRTAVVQKRSSVGTRSARTRIELFQLKVHDGQTIYVRKVAKEQYTRVSDLNKMNSSSPRVNEQFGRKGPTGVSSYARIGLILVASHLMETRMFYERVIGLAISQESDKAINFNGVLSLIPAGTGEGSVMPRSESPGLRPLRIRIETNNFDAVLERILRNPATVHTPVSTSRQRRFFRCFDPEGNVVEVTEA